MINHNAVYALYSNVVSVNGDTTDTLTAWDSDNNEVALDLEAVQNWVDPNEYKYHRTAAYPSIQEQLDMQYWDSINGTTVWADTIAAIKAKYPKPE